MDNLIKKIIREESEMKEMGVKVSRLAKLQPTNYLVKRVKNIEKEKKSKTKYLDYQNLFLSAIEDIKNLDWKNLVLVEIGSSNYDVRFPKYIQKKIVDSHKIIDRNISYSSNMLDKRFDSFLNDVNSNVDYDINIYMEEDRNRTHFPGGLPVWLLGLGLGVKIYRKLLNKVNYIQSAENASEDVKKLYAELIQSDDVNCVLSKKNTLLIDMRVPLKEKARIFSEFVFELYTEQTLKRKAELNKDIIVDSTLTRELGLANIRRLLSEIYTYAKKNPLGKIAFGASYFGEFPTDDEPETE